MKATRTIELTPERIARFWSKVDRQGLTDCWPWTSEQHTYGYGIYSEWSGNRQVIKFYAHRLSLLIAGHNLDGLVVRHTCDNPPCVNPEHLRRGTQADNMQDAIDRNRMNTSGLALGQATQWPPRRCLRCGEIVTIGRRRHCPPCGIAATRESHKRWRDKRSRGAA